VVSAAKTGDEKCPPFIPPQLAKALANPLRAQILVELNKRAMSPSQFANEFGHPVPKISRKFRELEKYKCIELVEEKRGEGRRGGVERFFRATQRAMFDDATWEKLPPSVRNTFSGVIFDTYIERVAQAMEAGTLDARGERHFTWTALVYDQQAWEELIARLNELFTWSQELQVEAALRMAKSGEQPIPVTVALSGFESPKSDKPAD
jgi:hypothetical protein